MSIEGNGSGCDLVKRMQPRGNLETCWFMFDHIECVGWMAPTCHMYDPIYYIMMTIVVCDMQSKYIDVQSVMWQKLNMVIVKEGVPNPNFMANGAQSKMEHVIQIVYGLDDPSKPMVGRKKTYYFHWSQLMDKHTKKHRKPKM
jgi:hypothetical protein